MADNPKPDEPKPDDPKDDDPKPDGELERMKAALRKANKEAEEHRRKLKELEDRDKSESEKLAERIAVAERRAAEAETNALRLQVANETGIAKARYLSGSTREELEASAAEYLADHPSAGNGNGPAPTKPVEDLRGGGEPAEGPDPDIRKIVESIPRGI